MAAAAFVKVKAAEKLGASISPPTLNKPLYLAAGQSFSRRLKIDDLSIYNVALTEQQMLDIAQRGKCRNGFNQPPLAEAGTAPALRLGEEARLIGSVPDDAFSGNPVTVQWSKVSGPGTVTFGTPASTFSTASFTAPGSYVLRLTASDGQFSNSDTVPVEVLPPINQPPLVGLELERFAIVGQPLALAADADDDGLPAGSALTYRWERVTGFGAATFSAPTALATTATFGQPGEYLLRFTASDGTASTSADVRVVSARAKPGPTIDAGAGQSVAFGETATLVPQMRTMGFPATDSPRSGMW